MSNNEFLLYNTYEEVKELYKYNDIPPPLVMKQPITTMPIIPFMATSPTKKLKKKYNLSSLLFIHKFMYK